MKRTRSKPITIDIVIKIKYLVGVVGLYQHQAAAVLGINQGRVSEVMTGKRKLPPDSDAQSSLPF